MDNNIYKRLSEDFEQAAFNIDRSRGFQLIGIRPAFITERLTEVFGLLGVGWRYARTPFEEVNKEVVVEIALQYRVEEFGVRPYVWNATAQTFTPVADGDGAAVWSEPVYASGGNQVGKGGVPMSDARKSAVSNALSKASSRIGVGIKAYKGLLEVDGTKVVVKEEAAEVSTEDAARALKVLLGHTLRESPELYDSLAASNSVAASHKALMVKATISAIEKAELTEFVAENLPNIVGSGTAKAVNTLTAFQLVTLYDVITAISLGKVTWKAALGILNDESLGDATWQEGLDDYLSKNTKEDVTDDDS